MKRSNGVSIENLPQVVPGWNEKGDGYKIVLNEAGARQLIDMLHQCIASGNIQGQVYQGTEVRTLTLELANAKATPN